jgi:ubiquinone/menaquinone biosynthesis C-methylase UbiE
MNNDKNICNRLVSKGVYPHQWAFALLCPLRNLYLSPKRLIRRLEIKEDSQVLEVGPGPGYFSVPVAKTLTQGTLTLADIQPEMLEHAKKRLTKVKLSNVAYHQCDGCRFDLPDGCFDVIFLVTVFGEVENKNDYLHEFRRLLKPNGILSFSEFWGDPDKMLTSTIRTLTEQVGFVFDRQYGSEWNYTINFRNG